MEPEVDTELFDIYEATEGACGECALAGLKIELLECKVEALLKHEMLDAGSQTDESHARSRASTEQASLEAAARKEMETRTFEQAVVVEMAAAELAERSG